MGIELLVTSFDVGCDGKISFDRLLVWSAFFIRNVHKIIACRYVVAILGVVYSKIFVFSSVRHPAVDEMRLIWTKFGFICFLDIQILQESPVHFLFL